MGVAQWVYALVGDEIHAIQLINGAPQIVNLPEFQSDLIPTHEWALEQRELQADSLGWLPLSEGAYLHVPNTIKEATVIHVVGLATDALELDGPVLLVG